MCVWETKLVWLLLRGTLSSWTQTYFSISIKWPVTGLRGGKIHKTFSKSCQSISQSCRAGQQALLTPILCMQLTAACVSVVFVATLGQRSALHFNHLPTTSELCHWTCRCGSRLMLIECFVLMHSQARFFSAVYKQLMPYTVCQLSLDKGHCLMDLHNEWISVFCNSAK